MRGEDTRVCRHRRGSVAALLVGTRLSEVNYVLPREVGHVVHSFDLALRFSRLENDGLVKHDIAIVGDKFAASRTTGERISGRKRKLTRR